LTQCGQSGFSTGDCGLIASLPLPKYPSTNRKDTNISAVSRNEMSNDTFYA
jgi:hypothetical protein